MAQQLAKDAAETEKELRWALFRSVVEAKPDPASKRVPEQAQGNDKTEVQR